MVTKETLRRRESKQKYYKNNKQRYYQQQKKYRETKYKIDINYTISEYLKSYKNNSKNRQRKWLLSKEEAISLFLNNCEYCGQLDLVNGIDRIDNDEDYHPWNVVSCCHTCNNMKASLSYEEFILHIALIMNK